MSALTRKRIIYFLVILCAAAIGAKSLMHSKKIEQYSFPYRGIQLGDSSSKIVEILGMPISQERLDSNHILEELAGKHINVEKLTYKQVFFLVVFESNQDPYIYVMGITDADFRVAKNIGVGTEKSKVLKVFGLPIDFQSDTLSYMNYEERYAIEFTLSNNRVSHIQMSLLND
jgi:hypothetical protein